jgi:hypothetical protein
MDKPRNNCRKCKCQEYGQSQIARFIKLEGLGIALAISVSIMVGGFIAAVFLAK